MARILRGLFSALPRSRFSHVVYRVESSNYTQLPAALSLVKAQHPGTFSVRLYANAPAANVKEHAKAPIVDAKELDCSPELKGLYEKFTTEVQGKRTVPVKLLRQILEQSNSPEDVALAFRVLQEYRVYRSSKARVKENFNENISGLAVSASLRSKSYGLGLKALWKHNIYGLSPSLENAHKFLSHARQEKDLVLMKKIFRTMLKNLVLPTTQTAEIMIRICKDNKDLNLMFNLAEELLQNGVKFSSPVFDILIATAANCGSVENVFKAQKWRKEAGVDHTIASAFAVAKAHVVQGEPQIGVDLIAQHCKLQDKVKLNKYLAMLVRVWPSELFSIKDQIQKEDYFTGLKDNVLKFAKILSKEFRGVSIDAENEFGKGGAILNKADGAEDSPQLVVS
eukprot:c24531_g1_i1 orf=755-1942(-)